MEDNLTVDEFNAFANPIIGGSGSGSGWSLDSLFTNISKLGDAAARGIGAYGASKAAIAGARADANASRLRQTQGINPGLNTSTLSKLLPWILGFGALIVAAIVILPLLKSPSK
jgi:hypothetical protein